MSDRHHDDERIDRAADEIRAQHIDDATARRITEDVWKRIRPARESQRPLRSCADFQAEITAFVAGTLPEARALLVGDHTRECVPCRRALMEARGLATSVSPRPAAGKRPAWMSPALRLAAAVILLLGGLASYHVIGSMMIERSLRASIDVVDGSLKLVENTDATMLTVGAEVRARQAVRTARDSGAVIRLADGSLVEMDERSELRLRASRRGTTIDLARGNIIVHAADQGNEHLYVRTSDCEVAVKGTIFAVNHGLKGSRVSVIEGRVEVHEGSASALLNPGDQITTGDRLRRVPLEEEISWSRDAAKHKALIRELTDLRRIIADAVDHAPPRTSTFLLDLAPGDTLVYVAMPNITADLDAARTAFYERLTTSPVLAEWWQENVVANGADVEINRLLDRLQPLGAAIGEEAVVTLPISAIRDQGTPLFMAELDDPSSFRDFLETVIEDANAEADGERVAVLVENPRSASPVSAEVYMWVEGDLFAAADSYASLEALANRVDDPEARQFVGSALHAQLSETYAEGVSWLFAANLAAAIAEGAGEMQADEAAALDRLGMLDATTVVIERHRDGDWYATNADIRFSGPRRGIVAWLAEPAPMGSLEFVSPDAFVAASAVTKDAEEMFDDLLRFVTTQDSRALDQLELVEQLVGIDLREDIAATIGGEATFAFDGPILPVPSLKLIVEVYDFPTLVHSIEQTVELANVTLAADGLATLSLEASDSAGRTYYTLKREGVDGRVVFTAVEGYVVAAPSRAVIDQAIDYRESGYTLTNSAAFRALLPDNGFTDCSALVYRDLGSLLDTIPPEMIGELESADALSDDLSQGLVCVFGEDDRITASATGGSLIGLASTLGICGAEFAEKNATGVSEEPGAVSSL